MARRLPLRDSRARAEEALRLRSLGYSWESIAAELGYGSRSAARMAVQRLVERTPAASPERVRMQTSEGLRLVRSLLAERLCVAVEEGDDDRVTLLAREVRQNLSEDARLHGAYAPQRTEVDVTVRQDAAAVIERAEADLLALVESRRRELPAATSAVDAEAIVDAEVVA